MEYLASAAPPPPPPPPQVGHTSPSDASHEYPTSHLSHGRNNSETSHTTGQSHIALLGPSGSGNGGGAATFPSYDPLNDTSIVPGGTAPASASDHPTGSFNRRTSGTPSTYSSQQRRKSSIAGAAAAGVGVERSGSVRRKPVPAVEALEDGGPSSVTVTAAAAAAGGGNDKQKSFVLDVEPRSLER
ncbi:hypothetical protein NliqN6_6638 [Naganishia liquefaciens]|uniref:Uncharacterized protein n=1 Tax=Naganishia liquefaciens TaxID=104408 RepID=A0A8H3YK66_9TREE|nr:hypothetical protein NliqN6_6638 [Naganishia liquefaciens]